MRPMAEKRIVSNGANRTEEPRTVYTNPEKETLLYTCIFAVRTGLSLAQIATAFDLSSAAMLALIVVSFNQEVKLVRLSVRDNLQQQ